MSARHAMSRKEGGKKDGARPTEALKTALRQCKRTKTSISASSPCFPCMWVFLVFEDAVPLNSQLDVHLMRTLLGFVSDTLGEHGLGDGGSVQVLLDGHRVGPLLPADPQLGEAVREELVAGMRAIVAAYFDQAFE